MNLFTGDSLKITFSFPLTLTLSFNQPCTVRVHLYTVHFRTESVNDVCNKTIFLKYFAMKQYF